MHVFFSAHAGRNTFGNGFGAEMARVLSVYSVVTRDKLRKVLREGGYMFVKYCGTLLGSLMLLSSALAATAPKILPGTEPFPAAVQQQLEEALAAKGKTYTPRTHHLFEDGSPHYTNRLILEPSPYLLQHAHNPVNWHSWGDAAFARAKQENKPVLLSIGYSTCHWCHVMEKESFEDLSIAEYLNRHYIVVKVDREQRPDLDGIYMTAVQMLTGRGGWPMTVWLTSDRQPFYGGTYFPPRDGMRGQKAGFLTLLTRLQEIYHKDPDRVGEIAKNLTQRIETAVVPSATEDSPTAAVLKHAAESFTRIFDAKYGGFGKVPKFPRSVTLEFLLRYSRRVDDQKVQDMVVKTLESMAAGGMYDQVGGGFHRYSTDREWLVPHFEKMLYDNALLTVAYLEGYQATAREDFASVAREILDYLDREMRAPGGGFYSATDADSEGEEGKFFVWTRAELEALLDPQQTRLIQHHYGVTAQGNFEGANIFSVSQPLAAVAAAQGLGLEQMRAKLRTIRKILYQARQKRIPPHTDTKVLVSWNGLAISAFARGAQVLGAPIYAERAKGAATFILTHMKQAGRLQRSALETTIGGDAYLDDYAFFIAGLLDLYEATFELAWLQEAIALQAVLEKHFWDSQHGGFFLTADDAEALLAREKPSYDGAEPSGNAVAVQNLLRLAELTTNEHYRQLAQRCFRAFASQLKKSPTRMPRMLSALDFSLDRPKEIAIVKASPQDTAEPLLVQLRTHFIPNRVVSVVTQGSQLTAHQKVIPWLEAKIAIKGKVTAYVCEQHVCALPTSDPEIFAKQIVATTPLSAAPRRREPRS